MTDFRNCSKVPISKSLDQLDAFLNKFPEKSDLKSNEKFILKSYVKNFLQLDINKDVADIDIGDYEGRNRKLSGDNIRNFYGEKATIKLPKIYGKTLTYH